MMDWNILAQALIAACVTIVLAYMQHRAAIKVEEVRVSLQRETALAALKLDEIAKVGQATHMLCNSAMMAQKRLLAVSARALASKTGTPEDNLAADVAEKELRDHTAKQAAVDARAAQRADVIPDVPFQW
jgi:hypothetical protein